MESFCACTGTTTPADNKTVIKKLSLVFIFPLLFIMVAKIRIIIGTRKFFDKKVCKTSYKQNSKYS